VRYVRATSRYQFERRMVVVSTITDANQWLVVWSVGIVASVDDPTSTSLPLIMRWCSVSLTDEAHYVVPVGKFGSVCMPTRCVNIETYVLVRRWVDFGRFLSRELDFEVY